jgi:hypothetical protein
MNTELFRPRGLYCLIVAHSNTAEEQVTQEKIAASIGTRIDPKTLTFGDRFKTNFRNADGTFGPIEFPASAELIFPGLEGAVGSNAEDAPKKNAFARAMERYGARRDRKRTAKWVCITTFALLSETRWFRRYTHTRRVDLDEKKSR